MMLTLYHAEPVANSLKALISLEEKGLQWRGIYIELFNFEQHEPAFVAINPEGQVPVLDHDGNIITHSTVICEYLEDACPGTPSLRPADPLGKARMRYWNKFCDEHVMEYVTLHIGHRVVSGIARAKDPSEFEMLMERIPLPRQREKWRKARSGFNEAELQHAMCKIEYAVDTIEKQLAKTPWLAGPMFTLADSNFYSCCGMGLQHFFPEMEVEKRAPRLVEWLARIAARPGVTAALATSNRIHPAVRMFTG